jgi:hypothetical protein
MNPHCKKTLRTQRLSTHRLTFSASCYPSRRPSRSTSGRGSRRSLGSSRSRGSSRSSRGSTSTRDLPDLRKGVTVSVSPALVLERLCEPLGHLFAVDVCDPSKGDVGASRDARRGPDVTVLDPARGRHPLHVGTRGRGPGPGLLVGRGFLAVEDAGAGEDRGARADRDDVFQLGRWVSLKGGCCGCMEVRME